MSECLEGRTRERDQPRIDRIKLDLSEINTKDRRATRTSRRGRGRATRRRIISREEANSNFFLFIYISDAGTPVDSRRPRGDTNEEGLDQTSWSVSEHMSLLSVGFQNPGQVWRFCRNQQFIIKVLQLVFLTGSFRYSSEAASLIRPEFGFEPGGLVVPRTEFWKAELRPGSFVVLI